MHLGQNPEWCSYSNIMIFGNETLNFYFYIFFFTLALISIACEHRIEKRRPEIRQRSQALLLAVKGFTKGAFHLSGLDGRTIARPVNLKMKWLFPRVFAEKPSPLVNTIQDLTDLAGEF